jgi:hypothetical protein
MVSASRDSVVCIMDRRCVLGLAIIAYLFGGPTDLIIPLFVLGVFTGIVEWLLRHKTS